MLRKSPNWWGSTIRRSVNGKTEAKTVTNVDWVPEIMIVLCMPLPIWCACGELSTMSVMRDAWCVTLDAWSLMLDVWLLGQRFANVKLLSHVIIYPISRTGLTCNRKGLSQKGFGVWMSPWPPNSNVGRHPSLIHHPFRTEALPTDYGITRLSKITSGTLAVSAHSLIYSSPDLSTDLPDPTFNAHPRSIRIMGVELHLSL